MKSQMKFQKILALVTLIIAALATILALFFCSGVLYAITLHNGTAVYDQTYDVQELYEYSQNANNVMVIMAIVLILVSALMFLMGNNSRRNYYISNVVATFIYVAYALAFAIALIVICATCFSLMNTVDFEGWLAAEEEKKEILGADAITDYSRDVTTLILGIIMSVVVIGSAVAWILNLLWKLKLMKGEKQLLENGGVASTSDLEVA